MKQPPQHFPRMQTHATRVDALAWYPVGTPGLEKMQYQARSEFVELRYYNDLRPGLVGVPRTLAPPPVGDADHRSVGAFEFYDTFTSELRAEQTDFVPETFAMLENEMGGIGEAPTGFGKTTTGCKIITKIGRPTCVIIPKGDLDWKDEIVQHTTIKENEIDYWQGPNIPDEGAKVVIAMLQSVYRDGVYLPEVYNRFACVIFDEVHRLGSPEFSAAIRKFPAMFRLGLSATADRRDGKMDLIHSHIGWRHVKATTDAAQPDYYVINSTWTEPIGYDGKVSKYDPSRTNQAKRSMMKDPIRNASIASAVYRAHKGGRKTILFIEQTKHGDLLHQSLLQAGVPEKLIVDYYGTVNADEKARAKKCAVGIIIIATYKKGAEGTNFPALDCVVFAHPIYDPIQPAGRVTRKHPGKPKPIVLDVWDNDCKTLRHIAEARWGFLRKNGADWKGAFS
ncbi:MAG: DEAD/DEAH box helicase family protein [Phycisphaeraceae bacterium]|nr:DEAD/DEAH box helicase family protein [Phycisphaeraceae bacterium]